MVRSCVICRREQGYISDVSFHSFPKNEETRAKWMAITGVKDIKSYNTICSRHFKDGDMYYKVFGNCVRRYLLPSAIPSLLMTPSDGETLGKTETDEAESCADEESAQGTTIDECAPGLFLAKIPNTNLRAVARIRGDGSRLIDSNDCIEDEDDVKQEPDNDASNEEVFHYYYPEDSNDNDSQSDNNVFTVVASVTGTIQKPVKKAHRPIPQSVKDLVREDFTSDVSWELVQQYINNTTKIRKSYNRKTKRLTDKITTLKACLAYLQKKRSQSLPNDKKFQEMTQDLED